MVLAMSAPRQFEIQLGHLCNDRCVFCVSGRLTHEGDAPLLETSTLVERIRRARAEGYGRLTLLGGEPTIQPAFLEVVREAVALGFEEIVVFSNGSKAGRTDLVDRVLATGGRFEWRLSFQGATREAHERTTRRKSSFDQLQRTARALCLRGQKITVNTCVVETNYASLPSFAALLLPFGVRQLHVDMLNPYDTGTMTDDEVRAIQPRYSDLATPLTRMVGGFPDGYDVNIGNLPYCVAPHLAPWIHHGGQPTWTVTADDFGDRSLQRECNKYLVKGSRKIKPSSCRSCVLDDRCDGVFEAYARWYGTSELEPVTPERLRSVDPEGELVSLHARPLLRAALAPPPEPFATCSVDEHDLRRVTLRLEGAAGLRLELGLSSGRGGVAATSRFRCEVLSAEGDRALLLDGITRLFVALEAAGATVVHPPGPDAFERPRPLVAAQLARLRAAAPFGALSWRATRVLDAGARAEIELASPTAEGAVFWVAERDGRLSGGYRLESASEKDPSPALVGGLREAIAMVSGGRLARAQPPAAR